MRSTQTVLGLVSFLRRVNCFRVRSELEKELREVRDEGGVIGSIIPILELELEGGEFE